MEICHLKRKLEEGVLTIVIDRPAQLNALNREVLAELDQVIDEAEKDASVRAIILTGEGKAFVAGADISAMVGMDGPQALDFANFGQKVFSKIENLQKIIIAAINGFALGGGFEVALACDIIYASDKAKLGFPEVTLGIHPGFGGTQRTAKLVGLAKAKELVCTGKTIGAQEAFEMGLVNKVVPHDQLMVEVMALAEKIKSNGPFCLRLAKECINKSISLDNKEGLALEAKDFGLCFGTKDQKEGMTAFVERRKPAFKGE